MIRIKHILIAFLLLSSPFAYTQQWRDSLSVSRNLYKKQEYGKAFKSYQSAQKLAPEGIDLSEEIGQSAYKSQQYKEAEEVYKQTSAKESDPKKKASNYHNLGNTRMKSKDYEGAVDAYKESLRSNPADNDTRYNLSEAMRELRNQQQNKNKDQQQNKNKDQQDQDQQNQNKQNQKEGGNKPPNQNGQSSGGKGKKNDGPKLKDKAVEKKLDELMKQEADTKRRLNGSSSEGGASKSGKDW